MGKKSNLKSKIDWEEEVPVQDCFLPFTTKKCWVFAEELSKDLFPGSCDWYAILEVKQAMHWNSLHCHGLPLAAAGTWWFSELALRDKHQVRAYDPIYADIPAGDNTEEK